MTQLTECAAARRRSTSPDPDRPGRADRGVPVLAGPLHRQHRLPQHLADLPRREPELAVLGAERLHHRVRRRCWSRPAAGPTGPGASGPSSSAWPSSPPRPPSARWPRRSACSSRARVLQASGGALMLPTSLGLLLPAFGPERKGAAIGLWSAVGGAAAAFGPPIGGLLVQASWRWVFLVNLPFSLLALVVGVRVLREVRDPAAHKADLRRGRTAVGRRGQPGGRHRRRVGLGLGQRAHPGRLRAGRRRAAVAGRPLASATPTRSSSRP